MRPQAPLDEINIQWKNPVEIDSESEDEVENSDTEYTILELRKDLKILERTATTIRRVNTKDTETRNDNKPWNGAEKTDQTFIHRTTDQVENPVRKPVQSPVETVKKPAETPTDPAEEPTECVLDLTEPVPTSHEISLPLLPLHAPLSQASLPPLPTSHSDSGYTSPTSQLSQYSTPPTSQISQPKLPNRSNKLKTTKLSEILRKVTPNTKYKVGLNKRERIESLHRIKKKT